MRTIDPCPIIHRVKKQAIISWSDHRLEEDRINVFDKVLSKPDPVRLVIIRDGRKIEIVVVPVEAE